MTSVRPLRPDDRAQWQPLWEGYLRFYRATPDPVWSETTFNALVGGEQPMAGLLAVDEEDVALGLAHLVFHASTWSPQQKCYLNDLFVDPRSRGTGAGKALIEATYDVARARGASDVYWHTQEFNYAARSLYDTVGQLTSFRVYEHELGDLS